MKSLLKALQITQPGQADIVELPKPEPAADEVLVRVECVTTCPHWDRHIFEGKPMFAGMHMDYPYWPGQPGHEAIGWIESAGKDIPAEWIGKRVAVWRDAGPYRNGLYATHGIVPFANVVEIPDNLRREKIASLELAMCVQVSIDQLLEIGAVQGKAVAVSGLGPAGLVALQLLRHAGAAQICAIDPEPRRRELALTLGADIAVAPDSETLPENRTGEEAFYAAVDTTGLPVSIEKLMQGTQRAVAIFGVLRDTVAFGPAQWYGGFSLLGYGEHNRGAADRALAAVLMGTLDLSPLVTHTMPIEKYGEAVAQLQSLNAIKVLLEPPV